jgi:hypothetical protein
MKILDFFLFLWVIFALLDPDPDPANEINADPCGSGSETLEENARTKPTKLSHEFLLYNFVALSGAMGTLFKFVHGFSVLIFFVFHKGYSIPELKREPQDKTAIVLEV